MNKKEIVKRIDILTRDVERANKVLLETDEIAYMASNMASKAHIAHKSSLHAWTALNGQLDNLKDLLSLIPVSETS